MDIKDENEREQWRTAFGKELQELILAAEQIIERVKPRGNQDSLWEDMDRVIESGGAPLILDQLRRILENWYDFRKDI